MSQRFSILKAKDFIRILKDLGFCHVRTAGSHIFFQHLDSRTALVPKHGGEDIGRGLTRQILKEIKITLEEFLKFL